MMASHKVLISILLVFTYFLGLAHEMIPHAHHNVPGSVAVMPLEAADIDHQNCLHSEDVTDKSQLAGESVCTSHHHYPPLCNDRTLYLPSLAHNLTSADDSADQVVFPLLTAIWLSVFIPEKPHFPSDSDVLIATRGPDEISLRGPPAFSC